MANNNKQTVILIQKAYMQFVKEIKKINPKTNFDIDVTIKKKDKNKSSLYLQL